MKSRIDNRIPAFQVVVAVLVALLWFSLLGYRDLVEPDEGRYAEIPREMVASGDWITPRLNGFKYFEKPALQYWMTAIGYRLFGQSNATARLWVAGIAFLCGLFVWYLGNRLYGDPAGFLAFLVTMSSLMFVVMGHFLTLDMSVSVFLVMGMGALVLAQQRRDRPRWVRAWMLVGWAMLGLAVLSKGLIGLVLPAGTVLIYSLWQRDWRLWRSLHLGKGLLVLLAITAPWFLLVSSRNDEFAHFFFIHEHFQRYLSTVHHREAPAWYFLPVFLLGVAPWVASTVVALAKPDFSWRKGDGRFDSERLLWVFVVFVLGFFSLGQSKLPPYILPAMPAAALLTGRRLASDGRLARWDGYVALALALMTAVGAVFITNAGGDTIPRILFARYRWWLLAGALALSLGGLVLVAGRRRLLRSIALAAFLFLLGFRLDLWGFQEIAVSRSSREVADAIQRNGLDDVPVFAVQTYPQSLPFYLQKTLRLVQARGELEMGIEAEPEKWIATLKDFSREWKRQSQAVAVLKPDTYDELRQQGVPMKPLYKGPRYMTVTRR